MDKEISKDVPLNSESDNELEIVFENISNYGSNSTLVEVSLELQEKIRISLEKGGNLPGKIKAIKVYAFRGNSHDMGSVQTVRARFYPSNGQPSQTINVGSSINALFSNVAFPNQVQESEDIENNNSRLNKTDRTPEKLNQVQNSSEQTLNRSQQDDAHPKVTEGPSISSSPVTILSSPIRKRKSTKSHVPKNLMDATLSLPPVMKSIAKHFDRENSFQGNNTREVTMEFSSDETDDDVFADDTILAFCDSPVPSPPVAGHSNGEKESSHPTEENVISVMLSPMELSSDDIDDDAFADDTILAFCDSPVPSPPVAGDSNGEKESSHPTEENVNSVMLSPMELSSDDIDDDAFADDTILAFCDSPVPSTPVAGDSNGEKESSHTTVEKTDQSKMGKGGELVALKYRKVVRSKKAAKFQVITSNVYPSCDCQGSKNSCKTNACTCVWFGQECQPTCGCRDSCPNMDLTRGEGKRIRIGASEIHGEGCFAEEKIQKGEYVGEYVGELVARAEQDSKKNPSLYLFEIGEQDFLLDASRFGSELSRMNHRMKGANCEFMLKRVGGVNRVGVWALQDIEGGQELFASYGDTYRGHGLITPYVKSISLSDVN